MRREVAIVGVLAAMAACGPAPTPPPGPPSHMTIEIGIRTPAGFEALEDGVDLELVSGAQGGYHVELAARVLHADGEVMVGRVARRSDSQVLVARTAFSTMVGADGDLERSVPVFLCPAPAGVSVSDETIEVTYTIDDATRTLAFQPRCPASDAFCPTICRR